MIHGAARARIQLAPPRGAAPGGAPPTMSGIGAASATPPLGTCGGAACCVGWVGGRAWLPRLRVTHAYRAQGSGACISCAGFVLHMRMLAAKMPARARPGV